MLDENATNDTITVQINAAVNGVNAVLVLKTDDCLQKHRGILRMPVAM